MDQSFPLIFAFDEIVALGYRENVNLALIRTFTDMDSHEERVFQAVRQVMSGGISVIRQPCDVIRFLSKHLLRFLRYWPIVLVQFCSDVDTVVN